jgi:hypothetical protein
MRKQSVVLFLILCSIVATSAFGQVIVPPLESEVIWASAEKTAPLFVPAATFEGGLESSPLSALDRTFMERRIAESKAASGACAGIVFAHRVTVPYDQRRTLSRTLADARTLLTGRVTAVVPGWSSWTLQPATLVWIERDGILHDRDATLGDDARFAFIVPEAELHIGEARLCSRAPGLVVPRVGDRVLVDAAARVGDRRLLDVTHYYIFSGDDILPQPFEDVIPFDAVSLRKAVER